MGKSTDHPGRRFVTPLGMVLFLAAVCGVLYIVVVPPWQHYDEPTHFEYAWLIANRGELPRWREQDPAMRREVAASMIEHGFFDRLGTRPDLLAQDGAIWIGVSQGGSQPLYYRMAAWPLGLVSHADITFQLYVTRALSLLFFLLTIWVAGRVVGEFTGDGHVLRWAVPGLMALLPAFTDVMTAVVDEVGATVAFSLFLWGATRMITRGVTVWRLIWVVGMAAVCVQTKATVGVVVVVLVPLALILALAPQKWDRWMVRGAAVGAVLLAVSAFRWGDAAVWYRQTRQEGFTRCEVRRAPLGRYALAIAGGSKGQVSQLLLREDLTALQGETVTVGSWMWADEATEISAPTFSDAEGSAPRVAVGKDPVFHAVTMTVSADVNQVEVVLRPASDREGRNMVYYDGVVLVEGVFPLDRPPDFEGPSAEEGVWGGRSFVNRVRNGSAETAWPWIRPWVHRMIVGPLDAYHWLSPTEILASALDWRRTGWVYGAAAVHLFRSFWGHFGWDHVRLADGWFWGLGAATLTALAGVAKQFVRGKWSARSLRWRRGVVCLGLAALLVWGSVILRPHPVEGDVFIPGARYAFPAVIPVALFLMGGWMGWAPPKMRRRVALILLVGLLVVDVASLITIATFYR